MPVTLITFCHIIMLMQFMPMLLIMLIIWDTFEWWIFLTLRRKSCGKTLGWTILNRTPQYTNMYCFWSLWRTKHCCSIDNKAADTPITDKISQLFTQTHVQPEPADLLILLSLFLFYQLSSPHNTHLGVFCSSLVFYIRVAICTYPHAHMHTIKLDGNQGGTALSAWHQHKSKL